MLVVLVVHYLFNCFKRRARQQGRRSVADLGLEKGGSWFETGAEFPEKDDLTVEGGETVAPSFETQCWFQV